MNEKIVNKWKPIIENCDYKGNKLEQIALYMESHASIDAKLAVYTTNTNELNSIDAKLAVHTTNTNELNILPLATRILMKIDNLNLDNVLFTTENVPTTDYNVSLEISRDEIELFGIRGIDMVTEFENLLAKIAIKKINDAIEELNIPNSEILFNTPRLVKSLSIISSNDMSPKLVMIISYNLKSKVKNERTIN